MPFVNAGPSFFEIAAPGREVWPKDWALTKAELLQQCKADCDLSAVGPGRDLDRFAGEAGDPVCPVLARRR
jgi:hypothetical protein